MRIKAAAFLVVALSVAAQTNNNDARDLLTRGVQLIPTKPAEAVKLLKDALRIDPELPNLHYALGLALHAIGDEADAEPELREAARRAPDSAAVHNDLGIALFNLGDAHAAIDEFRAAAKLAPKDANAHFNLGEAIARSGDSNGAVEELRTASSLAPSDAGLSRLLESVTANAIKVDVKQVLVPVVVTDREGHHVTGLKQSDFRVFEDGVEQKITAFSVESSGVAETRSDREPTKPTASVSSPTRAPVRRTYMICIDTLHSEFKNFAAVREALVKLFHEERSEDSQYVVVALGVSAEMIVQVTRDPAAVLAVFESKRMQKIYLDGKLGSTESTMAQFRGDLAAVRTICNSSSPSGNPVCEAGMSRLHVQSQGIAELDRTVTIGFLRELRALIAQLARARDRRTVVLISDGFGIEPGRDAFSLLDTYFPFASHCLVPLNVRCEPSGLTTTGRMGDEFEPILQMAAKSNVVIDTIDSRGLFAMPPSAGPANADVTERNLMSSKGNTLGEMAKATGGTFFHDDNDLLRGLERAFADGRDYYMVAYVPANESADGKFRAIRVEVHAKNANVNAKRGYWAAAQ